MHVICHLALTFERVNAYSIALMLEGMCDSGCDGRSEARKSRFDAGDLESNESRSDPREDSATRGVAHRVVLGTA